MPLSFRISYDPVAVALANRPPVRRMPERSGTVAPFWEFVGALENVSAGNLRALWLPQQGHTTTTTSPPGGLVWTYDASIAARISAQGSGIVVSFASASSQYGDTPDTANLSFGDATNDSAFSIVALANITNTAARRMIIGKYISTGVGGEWYLSVEAGDTLQLLMRDDSVPASPTRDSDAAITQGALHLFGASYSGVGGASNMNGATLYQDAAVIASTATNVGTYVAMENGTNKVDVGAYSDQLAGAFLDGSMGFAAVFAANLSLAQHLAVKQAVNKFYELTL